MKRIALRILALLLTAGVLVIPVLVGMIPSTTPTIARPRDDHRLHRPTTS